MPKGDNPKSHENLRSLYPELPEDQRPTKPMRFTLDTELADHLESLPKPERDKIMSAALRKHLRK